MKWQYLPLAALPSLMWTALRQHWHLILGGTMGGSWQLRQIPGLHLAGWSSALLFLTLLLLLTGWQWLGWRYRFESGTFHLRRGLWGHSDSLLPLAQVQSLQLHQSLLLRVLGLHAVTLETIGDASNYLHLPAVSDRQLLELRQKIGQPHDAAVPAESTATADSTAPANSTATADSTTTANSAVSAATAFTAVVTDPTGPTSPTNPAASTNPASLTKPEYRLSWPDLIRLSLVSGQTLMVGPILLALIHRGLLEIDKYNQFAYQKLLTQLDLGNQPGLLTALVLLLVIMWLGVALGWGVWRFGRFRLTIHSGLWHQHSGLVTHYAQSLNPVRTGAVIWRQNFLQRWLGRGWLHIMVQGEEAESEDEIHNELGGEHQPGQHAATFRIPWLSPRQARHWQMRLCSAIFAAQPGMNRRAARHQPLSPLYLSLNRRKLIGWPLLTVLALWLAWHLPPLQTWLQSTRLVSIRINPAWQLGWFEFGAVAWLWLGLIWLIVAEAGIRWRYRHWRFAVSDSALRIQRYTLACQRMLLPWDSIHSVRLRQSPLERRLGLASLEFRCLFGKVPLPCLPLADARTLFNYAVARSAAPSGAG